MMAVTIKNKHILWLILISLKIIYFIAVNFSQTVGQVESMQSNLDLAIQNQLQLLTDIQEGLSTNVQAMKASIQKLDDKLSRK
jgi:predicted PurR-regulated permease PerM